MFHNNHSGSCCGISNVYQFGYEAPTERSIRDLKQHISAQNGPVYNSEPDRFRNDPCRLIEVVLVRRQAELWHSTLKDLGFRISSQFINRNSGNLCVVYHLHNDPRPDQVFMPEDYVLDYEA